MNTGELIIDSSAGELIGAEIDSQIATAKQYPRVITDFKRTCEQLACMDEDTAASMFYVLKRGNKKIEGPSVRMAEVVAYSWTNLRTDKRVVSIDDKFVTAQGTCIDLERNVAGRGECKRRITNRDGKRFNDDMIQTTANAAMAIALREAVFSVVPRALFKDVYELAKQTSIGKATSMGEKRTKCMEWFLKAGATEEQVLAFVGRKSLDDVNVDDLITLRGVVTRIKDEGVNIEEALATEEPEAKTKKRVSKSKVKIKTEEPEEYRYLNELEFVVDDEIPPPIAGFDAAVASATTAEQCAELATMAADAEDPEHGIEMEAAVKKRMAELK